MVELIGILIFIFFVAGIGRMGKNAATRKSVYAQTPVQHKPSGLAARPVLIPARPSVASSPMGLDESAAQQSDGPSAYAHEPLDPHTPDARGQGLRPARVNLLGGGVDLKTAVVLSEILGPPRAKRAPGQRNPR